MADNVTLNPGATGAVIATDDVSGVQYQRVKLDLGGDGLSSPVIGALATQPALSETTYAYSSPTSGTTYSVACAGNTGVRVFITTSSQALIETSYDGGTSWRTPQISIMLAGTTSPAVYGNGQSGAGSPHIFLVNTQGCSHIRVRFTSTVSGSGTIIFALLGEAPNLERGQIVVETTNTDVTTSVPTSFLLIGGTKHSSETAVGSTNNGFAGALACDSMRRAIVTPYQMPTLFERAVVDGLAATTSTQLLAAVSSYKHYVTSLTIANEGATGTTVELLDGSTVVWLGYVAATQTITPTFPVPIGGTANTALNIRCRTASTVHVTSVGYRSQV